MANLNVCKMTLGGHLCDNPEIERVDKNNVVCNFSVAVNHDKENVSFIKCAAWNKTAEFIEKYFTKGSSIFVTGDYSIKKVTDKKTKEEKYFGNLRVNSVNFVDSKEEE